MFEIWNNPPMWHAINVHLPLVLAMVGLPLVAILTITRGRSRAMRWGLVGFYALLAGSAAYAMWTGHRAMDALSPTLPRAAWDQVNLHEWMAEKVWILGAITALCLLLVNLPRVALRQTFLALSLIASVVTTGWVIATGHTGGTAVYAFGLGTPGAEFASTNRAAPAIAVAPTTAPSVAAAPAPATSVIPAPLPTPVPAPAAKSGETVPAINIVKAVSYEHDIKPMLTARCVECHEGADAKSKYEVTSVASLSKNGRKAGPGVVPGNPDGSAVIQYITGQRQPQMPKNAKPLEAEQIATIRNWIAQGAVDDSQANPATPAPVKTQTADATKTQATSVPSPTTTAVATTSPSPTTQTVDATPAKRVYDPDEHLATWNPETINWSTTDNAAVRRYLRLQQVPVVDKPKTMPAGAMNPIDGFVMPRWPSDGATPQLCDDSTYIRRVTLDIIGMIPTAEEVQKFASDTSPDKRAKLV
ncbi:MAG TPA: DUF1549 domain-containing protein, partial [Tepidisphaeraceae bacterium]|nr:DUF1549 domain-containing protein [Tepidisphaeraceae bacterium]